MTPAQRPCWVDGELRGEAEAVLPWDDSAYREGRGCYTTARVALGKPTLTDRHVCRLQRDARALGLPVPDADLCQRALHELAAAAFPEGHGAIRLQASRNGRGELRLVGWSRSLGDDPSCWRAIRAPGVHPGASAPFGAKICGPLHVALARDTAEARGADEALLFDRDGRLVEGARSNLLIVDASGRVCTPPLERGGVAGIAREVVIECVSEVVEADVEYHDLLEAREVIALNALRGARPVVQIDDTRLAGGGTGPWARRLAEVIRSAG